MKKVIFIFLTGICLFFVASCGLSSSEVKRLEAIKTDSLNNVVELKKLNDSLNVNLAKKTMIEQSIILLDGKFTIAKDELKNLEGFKIGRTHAEREGQIQKQTMYIDNLKLEYCQLKKDYETIQESIKAYSSLIKSKSTNKV